MGNNVQTKRFTDSHYARFAENLQKQLSTLEKLLQQPGFGVGNTTLGAELELTLVNQQGDAQWCNQALLDLAQDPLLATELNRYNLEYNLSPLPARGKPFSSMAQAIDHKLQHINTLGKNLNARGVTIGILPTLNRRDISHSAMTDDNRYHVLNKALKEIRGHPLNIDIDGQEPLQLSLSDLNIEGANTSFQIHLRVEPDRFAACYNAAQLATAASLAISTNSPFLLGHQLWEETRIILFKQSVEARHKQHKHFIGPCRAGLGEQWLENSILELFESSVRDYPILIPDHHQEPRSKQGSTDNPPKLADLCLHHGSVWHWNRGIYDSAAGGHLRIEMRALPSGPTSLDMAANAAFMIGITQGLANAMPRFSEQLPFSAVQHNFYAAARDGLDAEFQWPQQTRATAAPIRADKVIKKLLPIAAQGLLELAVEQSEIDFFLNIIENRLETRQTGARWQRKQLAELEKSSPRKQALQNLLHLYLTHCASGQPVHQWSVLC